MSNFGKVDTVSAKDKSNSYADIFGVAANASLSYKYGMTANDKITVEGMFTSGDGNGGADGTLSSVITGNIWGSPTGIYSSHKALLLFPIRKLLTDIIQPFMTYRIWDLVLLQVCNCHERFYSK